MHPSRSYGPASLLFGAWLAVYCSAAEIEPLPVDEPGQWAISHAYSWLKAGPGTMTVILTNRSARSVIVYYREPSATEGAKAFLAEPGKERVELLKGKPLLSSVRAAFRCALMQDYDPKLADPMPDRTMRESFKALRQSIAIRLLTKLEVLAGDHAANPWPWEAH